MPRACEKSPDVRTEGPTVIAFLRGRLAEKGIAHCVLDVGGIGYHLLMSSGSLSTLPHEGDSVMVYTYLYVREDELTLFGFESVEEKKLFERLIAVNGVGPKVALAALSSYAPEVLIEGIASEDVALISSVPGIGAKTAQRIILDLKDKFGTPLAGRGDTLHSSGAATEAREALLGMGFSAGEIAEALKGLDKDSDPQLLLKDALKRLGGRA